MKNIVFQLITMLADTSASRLETTLKASVFQCFGDRTIGKEIFMSKCKKIKI